MCHPLVQGDHSGLTQGFIDFDFVGFFASLILLGQVKIMARQLGNLHGDTCCSLGSVNYVDMRQKFCFSIRMCSFF